MASTAASAAVLITLNKKTLAVPKPFSPPPPSLPRSFRSLSIVAAAPCRAGLRSFGPGEPRSGADVLVEALERARVSDVFAYPGGASVAIHQALTRSPSVTNHLLRHEQGEAFATSGYARSTGRPGVCISSSGPGATNLLSPLADALFDSVPLVAITGQVPRRAIGTDAFQETPVLDVARSLTKHSYQVLDAADLPRVLKEAFFLASSGRPGPVLVDVPKDVLQQLSVPAWDPPLRLPGYLSRLPGPPARRLLARILRLVSASRRPVLYVSGGFSSASRPLRRFASLTGIPLASTLTGLGTYPADGELSLGMLGMHGTVCANYAVHNSDLLLAFGARFDARAISRLESFARGATVVHVDIDPAEIGKSRRPHVPVCADARLALEGLNRLIEESGLHHTLNFSSWLEELDEQKQAFPLSYGTSGDDEIAPQRAIQVLDELTGGEVIVATGVGQHQMWAAQYYNCRRPRQWLSSAGLGAMGFGLPAAAGAAVGNPGATVVDIDGDGSFLMNVQELAMIRAENLPVKALILNNQHLGMVAQWEDCSSNRADSYLGDPANAEKIFPDLVTIAAGFNIPAARVSTNGELRDAIKTMLETPGQYLLDVVVPHQQHVLPMIPSGGAFEDTILDAEGRTLQQLSRPSPKAKPNTA